MARMRWLATFAIGWAASCSLNPQPDLPSASGAGAASRVARGFGNVSQSGGGGLAGGSYSAGGTSSGGGFPGTGGSMSSEGGAAGASAAGAGGGSDGGAGGAGGAGGRQANGGQGGKGTVNGGQGGGGSACRDERFSARASAAASPRANQVAVEHVGDQIRQNAVRDAQPPAQLTRQIQTMIE